MRNSGLLAIFLTLGAQAIVAAQPAAPATQQALADATTPKGTLIIYTRAMFTGDISGVSDLLSTPTPAEQKVAKATLRQAVVQAGYRQAVVKAFGDDAASQLTGISDSTINVAEQRINQAEVTVDKDKATVRAAGEPEPAELVKIDGKWRLSLHSAVAGMSEADVELGVTGINALSDVVEQLTAEIGQGKFKNVQELKDATEAKLASARLGQAANAPASRPAPAP